MAKEPELDAGGWELLGAFRKLSTERQVGMGVGPIPIRAIWDWETREGIYDPLLQDFVELVLMGVDALVCARLRVETEKRARSPRAPADSEPPTPNRPPGKPKRR